MKIPARLAATTATALALLVLVLWWSGSPRRGTEGPAAERETSAVSPVRAAELPRPELAGARAALREEQPSSPPERASDEARSVHEGRVRDLTGAPVGLVPIYRDPPGASAEHGEPFAVADASGAFTWTTPAWTSLVAESDALTTVLPAFAGSGACVIVVGPRRDYAGIAVDEAGLGLGGVELGAQMETAVARELGSGAERARARQWRTTSATDGSFRLEGVGWSRDLALVARLEGFVDERIPLPPLSTSGLEVRLRRPGLGARTIAGRVVDPAEQPVGGVTVAFEGGTETTSDGAGGFVVAAPEGGRAAVLWGVKAGHGPARQEFPALEAFLAAAPRAPVVLRLGAQPASIVGRVLEADGSAVEGARVFTWDLTRWTDGLFVETVLTKEDFPGLTTTAGDGRFLLAGLLARPYTLHAMDPRTLAVASRAAVEPGTEVLLVLGGEATQRVAGRVVDPHGEPVAGVSLFYGRSATRGHEHLRSPLVTDGAPQSAASGAFEIPALCVAGAYLLPAGEGIAQQERFVLDPELDLEHLVITVSRVCRFQIELADVAEADAFWVLDALEQRMSLGYTLGDLAVSSDGGLDLAGGRSEVVEADERARTLVLTKAGREVRRAPLFLAPGRVQVLRP